GLASQSLERQALERAQVAGVVVRGFDCDFEASFAFQDVADVMPDRDRLGELVDVCHGEAVARELVTVWFDAKVAKTSDLLDLNVFGSWHAPHGRRDDFAE